MTYSQAAIFKDIENDKYSEEEKAIAIYAMLQLETHNGFTKQDCINVIKWLWNQRYEFKEEQE